MGLFDGNWSGFNRNTTTNRGANDSIRAGNSESNSLKRSWDWISTPTNQDKIGGTIAFFSDLVWRAKNPDQTYQPAPGAVVPPPAIDNKLLIGGGVLVAAMLGYLLIKK